MKEYTNAMIEIGKLELRIVVSAKMQKNICKLKVSNEHVWHQGALITISTLIQGQEVCQESLFLLILLTFLVLTLFPFMCNNFLLTNGCKNAARLRKNPVVSSFCECSPRQEKRRGITFNINIVYILKSLASSKPKLQLSRKFADSSS